MWKVVSTLKQNLVWSIPAFMIAGLIVGALVNPAPLKALIIPLTFLMVYPMMINLQVQKVLSGGDFKVQLATQLINFAIVPFFAYGPGLYLFLATAPLVWLGLLLASLLPTSGMTISWTGFAKGNISAAIKMTVIGLILGSIATPFYATWLLGASVEIPLAAVFKQIVIIVFLPMILGIVTRMVLIQQVGQDKYKQKPEAKIPAFSPWEVAGMYSSPWLLKGTKILCSNPMLPAVIFWLLWPSFTWAIFLLSTLVGEIHVHIVTMPFALVYGYPFMASTSPLLLAIAMTAFGGGTGL